MKGWKSGKGMEARIGGKKSLDVLMMHVLHHWV